MQGIVIRTHGWNTMTVQCLLVRYPNVPYVTYSLLIFGLRNPESKILIKNYFLCMGTVLFCYNYIVTHCLFNPAWSKGVRSSTKRNTAFNLASYNVRAYDNGQLQDVFQPK